MTLVTTIFMILGMVFVAIIIAAGIILTYTLFKFKRITKRVKKDVEECAVNVIEVYDFEKKEYPQRNIQIPSVEEIEETPLESLEIEQEDDLGEEIIEEGEEDGVV